MQYIVYRLTSPSDKPYIGYTKHTAEARFNQHAGAWKRWVKNGRKRDQATKILCAFDKYPPEEWKIEILHAVEDDGLVQELEREEIERHDSINEGYNMIPGGRGGRGKIMTEEHKRKLSESRKKYFKSEEGEKWKKQLSEKLAIDNPCKKGNTSWNKGKKAPQIGKSLKKFFEEKVWTEEERERARQNALKNWENGAYDNRPTPSEETRRKISEAGKGRKQTDFQKQRAREANTGKTVSADTRSKIGAANRGRKLEDKVCPHCGKNAPGGNAKRWHFDNCREINK